MGQHIASPGTIQEGEGGCVCAYTKFVIVPYVPVIHLKIPFCYEFTIKETLMKIKTVALYCFGTFYCAQYMYWTILLLHNYQKKTLIFN